MKQIIDPAPVALFIFRRPEHTRKMITSLMACDGFNESPVYVFCDGPRSAQERDAVAETRLIARQILGDRATFVEREVNFGLANSVVSGVTDLCNTYGKVIVIEDDLVLSPEFLVFMNQGLTKYADAPKVMHISGYVYDVDALRAVEEAQFLPMTSSWGWATWKRAWDGYDIRVQGWEERLGRFQERWKFDLDGHANHWRMLKKQMRGELDTWDIQWYYHLFIHDGLGLFPPRTLVRNEGMDGSGTHYTSPSEVAQQDLELKMTFTLPDSIVVSRYQKDVYAQLRKMIWQTRLTRIVSSLQSRIRELARLPRRWS